MGKNNDENVQNVGTVDPDRAVDDKGDGAAPSPDEARKAKKDVPEQR